MQSLFAPLLIGHMSHSNYYVVFNCIVVDIQVECITTTAFFGGELVNLGVFM